jgi:hypothetical protein
LQFRDVAETKQTNQTMKSQFITTLPLIILCIICALYAAPRVSLADFGHVNMLLLSPDDGGSGGSASGPQADAPIESQPGVVLGASGGGEPENKEGVKQAEDPKTQGDIQDYARQQAERNEQDVKAGNPAPDRPATAANLASFQAERAKTVQEDQASAQARQTAANQQKEEGEKANGEGGEPV